MLKIEVYVPSSALNNLTIALVPYGRSYGGMQSQRLTWQKCQSMWYGTRDRTSAMGVIYQEEYKVILHCYEADKDAVIETIKKNHPYNDITIDITKLEDWK